MNRAPRLADLLAREQVERINPNHYRLVGRPDGTTAVTVDDDGVSLIGPVYDLGADDIWPFEAGTKVVVFRVDEVEHARMVRDGVLDDVGGQNVGEALIARVKALRGTSSEND